MSDEIAPVYEKEEAIHEWISKNNLVNEKGEPILFFDHQFLLKPYSDFTARQVYKKCSQVGVSVMMNLKSIYVLKTFRYNIIYTLPSDSDVWEFVPSKTDKMIMSNPSIRSLLQTDKVQMKQINERFIYFKGTRSKTAPIMTTADLLIHDELDRSDLNIIEQYSSRTKRSKYKGLWQLSNPWMSNSGVDIMWRRSNQQEWFVECPHCKYDQMLKWPDNVDYNKKIFVCSGCRKEMSDNTRRLGRWVQKYEDSDISGYHISQLMAPWINAAELIREEGEKDEEYFNNFILGEPISGGSVEDFRSAIIDATTVRDLKKGPYFMGIDVGRIKYYVIGNEEGIFKIGRAETREQLEDLIEKWDPFVVMDAGPERTWAEEFRKKYNKFWMCWFHRDKDRKIMIKWGEDKDTGYVWADRNRTIDNVVADLVEGEILYDVDPATLDRYIKHWNVLIRKEEEDKLGRKVYIWDKNSQSAQDHWAFATVYYWIARSRGGKTVFAGSPKAKRTQFITQTKEGKMKMEDIENILDDNRE